MSDYIDTADATHIRIYQEDTNRWYIDAADDRNNYTDVCWDSRWQEVDGQRVWEDIQTLDIAFELAEAFARENTPHLLGSTPKVNGKDHSKALRTVDEIAEETVEEFLQLLQGEADA